MPDHRLEDAARIAATQAGIDSRHVILFVPDETETFIFRIKHFET